MADTKTVYVNILDKDYQVSCPPEERRALDNAAAELDGRMRAIRASGNIIGVERIAVMAALNLCHELQSIKENQPSSPNKDVLERMANKLDKVLQSN